MQLVTKPHSIQKYTGGRSSGVQYSRPMGERSSPEKSSLYRKTPEFPYGVVVRGVIKPAPKGAEFIERAARAPQWVSEQHDHGSKYMDALLAR